MRIAAISTRRVAFDWPPLLFLLSAIGGIFIAYNPSAAWPRFWLIVGGLALYVGFVYVPEQIRLGRWELSPLRLTLVGLPVLVTIYFLLTNDWASRLEKLPWLDPMLRWFSTWLPGQADYGLHSNVVGGVIAAFIPMQVAASKIPFRGRNRIWISAVLVGLSTLGLLLSESRGAWLALAIATGGWGLWELVSRRAVNRRQAQVAWAAMVAAGSLVCVLVLTLTPLGDRLLNLRTDRLSVWRNSLDLASDYTFTGLGLGGFTMAYSSYALLVHVPHTAHAHNLFLDIWLEQGLLGLLVFGGWVMACLQGAFGTAGHPGTNAAWPKSSASRWRPAALASLAVILMHGLADDAFYGYGGRAIPLLFLPLAVLVRPDPGEEPAPSLHSGQALSASEGAKSRFQPAFVLWSVVAFILVVASLLPGVRATGEANLGALVQTRTELAMYSDKWGIQDVLRRSSKVDLTRAISHYQAALARDPTNATANRRLGQIELSLGQYDAARSHLEAAYATAPGQRATRQMLGECYAIAGETNRAVALWRTVDVGQGQLDIRQSWYIYLGEKEHAAGVTQAATSLK